jgi:hypothetical protein
VAGETENDTRAAIGEKAQAGGLGLTLSSNPWCGVLPSSFLCPLDSRLSWVFDAAHGRQWGRKANWVTESQLGQTLTFDIWSRRRGASRADAGCVSGSQRNRRPPRRRPEPIRDVP